MSTKPGRQKSPVKRAAILEAAHQLFCEVGFKAVSMDTISKHAGVSKKTLYSHFTNKEKLFTEVISNYFSAEVAKCKLELCATLPPYEGLLLFVDAFSHFLFKDDSLHLINMILKEIHIVPEAAAMMLEKECAPFTSTLHSYLKDQINAGNLNIEEIWVANAQLIGMIKEENYLAIVTGFIKPRPPAERSIANQTAVNMFIRYYATDAYREQLT